MASSPETTDMRAVLRAVKDDPMACHSIAVWEQIDAALADDRDPWAAGFVAACRLHGGDGEGYRAAADRYLAERGKR
jgi:hypothetical protein